MAAGLSADAPGTSRSTADRRREDRRDSNDGMAGAAGPGGSSCGDLVGMSLHPRLLRVATSPAPGRPGDEPRDLPEVAPHLAHLPGHLIRRAGQVHTELWSRHVSPSVSSVQFAVLSTLARQEPLDQAGLARLVALDPASAHAVVHRLEASGHLTMARSETDARRYDVRLTEAGRRLHAELAPRVEELRAALEARLPPERTAAFLRLLEEFVAAG
jgi:DNA-binding MarR family transcriptional regulator